MRDLDLIQAYKHARFWQTLSEAKIELVDTAPRDTLNAPASFLQIQARPPL